MADRYMLRDIRVLDLGMFMAGPLTGRFLGEMGVEVIKVEAGSRPDPLRFQARDIYPGGEPGERPWNRSGMINERNRSKLGLSLDLKYPEGREIFLDLVRISDVVLENFRTGVLDSYDLGYESLRRTNPSIIQVSLTSQGAFGPEASFGSAGATLEYMSGLMSITGYPGDWPDFSGPNLPDFLTPYSAVGLTVAALLYRRRTGKGVWVDLAQREVAVAAIGDVVMDYTMNQRCQQPMANRHATHAPHGVFRCAGEDRWVALAVRDDDEWGRLCSVLGRQELGYDPRFVTREARHQNQDELTPVIEEWTSRRSPTEAMEALQARGIPAGAVLNAGDLYRDPHLRERGFFDTVDDPDGGTFEYPGRPWKFSHSSVDNRSPTPLFGEHTRHICEDIMGIPEARLNNLVEQGVLATEPSVIYQAVPTSETT